MMAAIDCVAQGLGEESATKALAEAAFNSMEDAALTRSFLGLSAEQQLKIVNQVKQDFGEIPAPWETAEFGGSYLPGSYTGADYSISPLSKVERQTVRAEGAYAAGSEQLRAETIADPLGATGLRGAAAVEEMQNRIDRAARQGGREAVQEARQGAPTPTGEGQGLFGMDYSDGEFNFNQGRVSQGSGGSYGAALGNVQKEAFDALRSSMLKSLGADELLEAMNRLPGAPIIAQMLKRTPCRQTPLIYSEPRLDSFLNTLEFDFCQVLVLNIPRHTCLGRINCNLGQG